MEHWFGEDKKNKIKKLLFEMVKEVVKEENDIDKKSVLKEMKSYVEQDIDTVFEFIEKQLSDSMSNNEAAHKYVDKYIARAVEDAIEKKRGNVLCHLNEYMDTFFEADFVTIFRQILFWGAEDSIENPDRYRNDVSEILEMSLSKLLKFRSKDRNSYCEEVKEYGKQRTEALQSTLVDYCNYILKEQNEEENQYINTWKSMLYFLLLYCPKFIENSIYRENKKIKGGEVYYFQAMEKEFCKLQPGQGLEAKLFRKRYEDFMRCIGYKTEGKNAEYELPVGMTPEMLVYLLQYRVEIGGRRTEEEKGVTFFEVIKAITEKIQQYKKERKTSVRKFLLEWKEQKQFSPRLYVELGKKLKLGECDKKSVSETLSRHDAIDEYTGYVVSLTIWRNLIENSEKYIPSINSKKKEEIYNALRGNIAEIVSLKRFFTGTELALLVDCLYSLIPVMVSSGEKKDIKKVLNSMTMAIQGMNLEEIFEFYEKYFSGLPSSSYIMGKYKYDYDILCIWLEGFILQNGTIDESKMGSVSSKNSILFSQIQKSVLVARYFDKVQ